MPYPFMFIDQAKSPPKPDLYLCKPDKTTIGKLTKHIDKLTISPQSGNIYEMSFTIHKNIWVNDHFERNRLYDLMYPKYLVRLEYIWGIEYYVIDNPKEENGDDWSVHCYISAYELQNKTFDNYTTQNSKGEDSPVDIKTALTDALSKSYSWSVGHIDDTLLKDAKGNGIYRSFEVDGQTALDFVLSIAEKFNAIADWDTVNNKVNMYDADKVGVNKGLRLTWKHYLQACNADININDLATRLHCKGKDDLTFHSISPIGQDYVYNYDYFLDGFTKDNKGNITKHSRWMSDELCEGILDYQALVDSHKNDFKNLLAQQISLNSDLLSLQNDLSILKSDLVTIKSTTAAQSGDMANAFFDENKDYKNIGWTFHSDLYDFNYYALMGVCSGLSSIPCQIDGGSYTVNSTWHVLKKIADDRDGVDIAFPSGKGNGSIHLLLVMIKSEEYSTANNESAIIDTYNQYVKQQEIDDKQSAINAKQSQLNQVNSQISALKELLNIKNHLSISLLEEFDHFVNESDYSNDDCTTAQELMDDGEKELIKRQQPTYTFDITIINFLSILEGQRDWDRLSLNDIVTLQYDDIHAITARIIGMNFDFDNNTIQLTISNVKDIRTDQEKVIDEMKKASQSAITLQRKKKQYDQVSSLRDRLDVYVNSAINANNQTIVGGLNNTEKIDQLGYLSQTDENNATRLYRGCLLSTSDGGNTWKVVYSPAGVNAKLLTGTIITGDDLNVLSADGAYQFNKNGLSLDADALNIKGGLNEDQLDNILVSKINKGAKADNVLSNIQISTSNLLNSNSTFGSKVDF